MTAPEPTPTPAARAASSGPPASANLAWVSLIGFVGFAIAATSLAGRDLPRHVYTSLCMIATGAPMMLVDVLINRVHRRDTAGLSWGAEARPGRSFERTLVKYAGLAATLGALAFVYWLAPEWSGTKHSDFFNAIDWAWPVLLPVALLYIPFVDAHMRQPEDATFLTGALLLGKRRWAELDAAQRRELREHALGWVIKGFYLPQMFDLYVDAATGLSSAPWGSMFTSSVSLVKVGLRASVAIDMAFGALGYCATLRLFDAQIRSTNPLAWGWMVTIMMYQPFWSVFSKNFFAYGDREDWHKVLPDIPPLLWTWAILIVATRAGWAWANSMYGSRFSNLTHRGIITAGPYRWTRHPSYLFKNLSWWLAGLPFLGAASTEDAIKASLAMLCVNGIYLLRAKAEEHHLSEDPTYVAYANWVEENSPLRFLRKIFPFIRYRHAAGRQAD